MLIHAKKEELQKLAKCLFDITQTMFAIYDVNKVPICAYPQKMSGFCAELRKSSALNKRCIQCDHMALEQCEKNRSVYPYHCHMGLIEVATPILCNDIVIGYVLFGQLTDREDRSPFLNGLQDVAQANGLDYCALKNSIGTIQYRTPEYIASISKIVEMCACYIWQNSFLSIKNNSTANSLDLYIQEHLNENLSVPALCQHFSLSRSALYSISREYFGCGISEYISQCRIRKAKLLLEEGQLSVSAVAENVGISDTNYFIRCFKKAVGITPKQYQKSSRRG